jgi:hypothetical protein
MDFAKQEIQAVESVATKLYEAVIELDELELATIGGGSGAVSLG